MVVGGVPPFHQRQPRPPTYFSDVQVFDLSKQARSCPNLPEYPIAMNAATGKGPSINDVSSIFHIYEGVPTLVSPCLLWLNDPLRRRRF